MLTADEIVSNFVTRIAGKTPTREALDQLRNEIREAIALTSAVARSMAPVEPLQPHSTDPWPLDLLPSGRPYARTALQALAVEATSQTKAQERIAAALETIVQAIAKHLPGIYYG
jgi:predicted RNA-binding Zn ribbon-like protein